MTVASTTSKSGPYACNGVTVAFALGFACQSQLDLQVVRTDTLLADVTLVLAADYTVSLNVDQTVSPGGTITLIVAPATGFQITVLRAVQTTQGASLPNQGGWYPKVVENALDKLTMLTQQLAEQIGRSIKVGVASPQTPDQLIATLNANAASATDSATAASGSATAAAGSATAASGSAIAAAASATTAGSVAVAALTSSSTTSLLISLASKSFTTQANKAYVAGYQFVTLVSNANSANYMLGIVTAYDAMTGAMTVTALVNSGSGTFADWNISVSGSQGQTGANGVAAATTLQTLTDAATVAFNWSLGRMAKVTIAGNRIMGLPTNLVNDTFYLYVTQDATGGRVPTWNAIYKWSSGVVQNPDTAANRTTIYTGIYDGTNIHIGLFSFGSR